MDCPLSFKRLPRQPIPSAGEIASTNRMRFTRGADLAFKPGVGSNYSHTTFGRYWIRRLMERAVIRFDCPACGKRLKVSQDSGGRSGTCPKCLTPITTPGIRTGFTPTTSVDHNPIEAPAGVSSPAPPLVDESEDWPPIRRRKQSGVSIPGLALVSVLGVLAVASVTAAIWKVAENNRRAAAQSKQATSSPPRSTLSAQQTQRPTASGSTSEPGDQRLEQARSAVTGILLLLGACAVFVGVVVAVRYGTGCTTLEAIGYVLVGIFLFLLALLLTAGNSDRSTKWPLNCCGRCGHSWYPRGTAYSPWCPRCGIER